MLARQIETEFGPALFLDPFAPADPAAEVDRAARYVEAEPAVEGFVDFKLEDAISQGATSLILFGHLFLPNTFRQESPEFHYDIAELLSGVDRYVALKVFRDAAKTTLLRAYALQRIAYGLSRTIFFTSATQAHSVISLRWLKKQVESNKRVGAAFGLRKGAKWTDEWIEILLPDGTSVNVLAAGLTGQIRGFNLDDFRPDLILLDDGQTEESVGTPEQRKKTNDLVFGALANSLAPASENPLAKLVMLQTPMEAGDAIDLACKSPEWAHRTYSILRDGESTWPARYPTKVVLAKKAGFIQRGQYALWMREYEVAIAKSEHKVFDVARLRVWEQLPTTRNDCICAIDPASSDGRKADDNVVLTAVRSGPDIYVAAYVAERGQMPDAVARDFFEQYLAYRPTKLRIETVGYQRILKWYLENEMKQRRLFVPVDAVQDKRAKSDRIVQALAGLVAHGYLHIHSTMTSLIDQMRDYEPTDREQHDDILDALAMAVDGLNNPFMTGSIVEGTLSDVVAEEERMYGRMAGFRRAP